MAEFLHFGTLVGTIRNNTWVVLPERDQHVSMNIQTTIIMMIMMIPLSTQNIYVISIKMYTDYRSIRYKDLILSGVLLMVSWRHFYNVSNHQCRLV